MGLWRWRKPAVRRFSRVRSSDLSWMRRHGIVTLHLLISFSGFWYIGWYCCWRNLNGYRAFPENLFSCVRLSGVNSTAIIVRWIHRWVLLRLCAILRVYYTILEIGRIMIQVRRTRFRSRWWRSDKAGHTLWRRSIVHTGQEGILEHCCSDDPSSPVSDWSRSWALCPAESAVSLHSLLTQLHWAEQGVSCWAGPPLLHLEGEPLRAGPPH